MSRIRLVLSILTLGLSLFETACATVTDLENAWRTRQTPSYVLLSSDPEIQPGTATLLPTAASEVQPGNYVGLQACHMEAQFLPPKKGYDQDLLDGGLIEGIWWDRWSWDSPPKI